MYTKTTILIFALPLALALGVPAYAQQPMQHIGQLSSQVPPAGSGNAGTMPALQAPPLKAKAPSGCTQWVTDGQKGLSILDERIKTRNQQLLTLMSALTQQPKDKKLSRQETESLAATTTRLKALELEIKCDVTNHHAFVKENLGLDKKKESEGSRSSNDTTTGLSLEQTERMMREIRDKLQQILDANADATRNGVKNL